MSTTVLARKYRPRRFAEMVGQEHVVKALSNALTQQRLHHAYLFTGTRGIGKTTVSRILAKSLNCTGPDGQGGITAEPCGVCTACTEIDADRYIDYIELDAASNRSIDEIRDLIERAAYKPGVGRFKVFMIDEAHQLTKDAFNALLKTLEEPPDYLKFVLATTDPEKMLPTVLSRCLQFNLRPMAPATVREHLARVLAAESIAHDEGSLRLLARAARGSMRDGLSLTDQAIAFGGGRLEETAVRDMLGGVDRGQARALVEALARRDGAALLGSVAALRAHGFSATGTLEAVSTLLQAMAIEQAVPGALDADDPDSEDARALAPLLAADETQLLYSITLHGRADLPLMSDEYGALAMVLLRFLAFPATGGVPALAPPGPSIEVPRATPPREPAGQPPRDTARTAPLRVPPPPAISLPAVVSAPVPVMRDTPRERPGALADRWAAVVGQLLDCGAVQALARELALQSGLVEIVDSHQPPTWRLIVEREALRAPATRDKLQQALAAQLDQALQIELVAGVPEDTVAQRLAAERARRQAEAEATIHADPVVRELLGQFKTARVVPGSIQALVPAAKPSSNEGSSA
jgi:DNA polymerase III subunit gamma/tau